jgi:hypothetical protein
VTAFHDLPRHRQEDLIAVEDSVRLHARRVPESVSVVRIPAEECGFCVDGLCSRPGTCAADMGRDFCVACGWSTPAGDPCPLCGSSLYLRALEPGDET